MIKIKKALRNIKYKFEYYLKKKLPIKNREGYISKIYMKRIGHQLDWKNLKTYTEKMQYSKLYDINELKVKLTDKIAVRDWVANKIGKEYLIPLLGIYSRPEEIDYDMLPSKFVIKTNHGSGTNIIVRDKSKIDINKINKKLNVWINQDFSYISCFEMHYSSITTRIMVEQLIETPNNDLQDYKFLCFNSMVYYCWVDTGRYTDHKRSIYNLDWELQPFNQYNYNNAEVEKPKNFDQMVKIAEKLCKGFSHVRVDLYNVSGKIYFGEMTFTNGGGFEKIIPEKYDRILGDLWNIDINYNT